MLVQQRPILPREFFVRFEQAVFQLDIVDFVWLRFQFDHIPHGRDGPPGRPNCFGAPGGRALPLNG